MVFFSFAQHCFFVLLFVMVGSLPLLSCACCLCWVSGEEVSLPRWVFYLSMCALHTHALLYCIVCYLLSSVASVVCFLKGGGDQCSALLASVCSLLCAAAVAGAERAAFSTCSAPGWSVVTHCLGPDHLVTLFPAESSAHLWVGPGGCGGVPRHPPVSHQGKPLGPGEWDKMIVGLEWGQECIKYATTEGSVRR